MDEMRWNLARLHSLSWRSKWNQSHAVYGEQSRVAQKEIKQ